MADEAIRIGGGGDDPLSVINEVAARLGVPPVDRTAITGGWLVSLQDGNCYEVGKLLRAFLDRMDEVARLSEAVRLADSARRPGYTSHAEEAAAALLTVREKIDGLDYAAAHSAVVDALQRSFDLGFRAAGGAISDAPVRP